MIAQAGHFTHKGKRKALKLKTNRNEKKQPTTKTAETGRHAGQQVKWATNIKTT